MSRFLFKILNENKLLQQHLEKSADSSSSQDELENIAKQHHPQNPLSNKEIQRNLMKNPATPMHILADFSKNDFSLADAAMYNPIHQLNLLSNDDFKSSEEVYKNYAKHTKNFTDDQLDPESEENFHSGKNIFDPKIYLNTPRISLHDKKHVLNRYLNNLNSDEKFHSILHDTPNPELKSQIIKHPKASVNFLNIVPNLHDKDVINSDSQELQDLDKSQIKPEHDIKDITSPKSKLHLLSKKLQNFAKKLPKEDQITKENFDKLKSKLPENQWHGVNLFMHNVSENEKSKSLEHLHKNSEEEPYNKETISNWIESYPEQHTSNLLKQIATHPKTDQKNQQAALKNLMKFPAHERKF